MTLHISTNHERHAKDAFTSWNSFPPAPGSLLLGRSPGFKMASGARTTTGRPQHPGQFAAAAEAWTLLWHCPERQRQSQFIQTLNIPSLWQTLRKPSIEILGTLDIAIPTATDAVFRHSRCSRFRTCRAFCNRRMRCPSHPTNRTWPLRQGAPA